MKKYDLFTIKNGDYVLYDKPFPVTRKHKPYFNAYSLINGHDMMNLIVHANVDINNYNLYANDLFSDNGEVLSKENFKIYNCKYTPVKRNIEAFYGFGVGFYPNALLPIDKAVEYKENKISKNCNQMLFASVYIPKTQTAGEYNGSFTLEIDGEKINIPAKVKVSTLTLTDENHLQCLALTDWDWHGPDKLNDFETYQSYTKLLEEYRMSPLTLIPYPQKKNIEQEYIRNAELTYEFCLNPTNSVYTIPYLNYCNLPEGKKFVCQSSADMGLIEESFIGFTNALVDKSFEKGYNLFKKAVTYFGRFVDEPEGQGTLHRLEPVYKQYKRLLKQIHDNIVDNQEFYKQKYGVTQSFIDEVKDSVLQIPNFVTNRYLKEYDDFIDVYCPIFWHLQPEENFEYYNSRRVRWWYGCNGPLSPCPTNHLDDSLLSPRIIPWLQYKFDVKGNLIFGVNFYEGATNYDWYAYNTEGKNAGDANGDGLMVFPGSPYGLNKPLSSLRVEYIRAGMEDAEVLFALREEYNKAGLSFDKVFDVISPLIFEHIKIFAVTDTFSYVREIIIALLELAQSDAKFFVKDIFVKNNVISGKLLVNDDYEIVSEIVEKIDNGYSFCGKLEHLTFKITGKNEYRYSFANTVKRNSLGLQDLVCRFENVNADIKYNVVNYKNKKGDKAINIVIPTRQGIIQTANLKLGDLINKNTYVILLYFYSEKANEKYECFTVKAKYKNKEDLVVVSSLSYIAPQTSVMPICLHYNDWENGVELEYLQLDFGEDNDEYKELGKELEYKEYLYLCGLDILEKSNY